MCCFQLQEGKISWSVEKVVLVVWREGIGALWSSRGKGDKQSSDVASCTWECVWRGKSGSAAVATEFVTQKNKTVLSKSDKVE